MHRFNRRSDIGMRVMPTSLVGGPAQGSAPAIINRTHVLYFAGPVQKSQATSATSVLRAAAVHHHACRQRHYGGFGKIFSTCAFS